MREIKGEEPGERRLGPMSLDVQSFRAQMAVNDGRITAELPGNRCTTCHRPSCDNRFAMPLADLMMPAPFDRYHYTEDFAEDRRALRDWCDQIGSR